MRRVRRVSPRNFLAGLSPDHFEVFRSVMRPVEFGPGETLFCQGDLARCAYIVDTGRVVMSVRLPSGGERLIADAGSGEILGELGLIADTRRSTTARADGAVRGFSLDRVDLQGLLAYFHPASLAVTQRLALLVSERIRETTERLTSLGEVPTVDAPSEPSAPGCEADRVAGFDYRPFLPRLPFFADFTGQDIDELLELVGDAVWSLRRGRQLYTRGEPTGSAYLVVRGAVELLAGDPQRSQRVALLGPGGLVGLLSPLLGEPRCGSARVREDALLLELPPQACAALQAADRRVSFKFMTAYVRHLARRQAELNRLFIRLEQAELSEPSRARG